MYQHLEQFWHIEGSNFLVIRVIELAGSQMIKLLMISRSSLKDASDALINRKLGGGHFDAVAREASPCPSDFI